MPNALSRETSPYLLQHADNPVDWHPWGPEALALSRESGRPILLSIGYSACHWCHVMARESFEDAATAEVMNRLYVNVKVDREERPDIDRIYQIAHQMLTQRGGGWPLTMFLAHDDQRPFFGGTYFPDAPRHGMPAFRQVLERVADWYSGHREELRAQNDALSEAFAEMSLAPIVPAGTPLTEQPLDAVRAQLASSFDRTWGGFGAAPKFPHPTSIETLLRHWHSTAGTLEPDLQSLYMATLTLTRMGEGGLYDQVGGGFSRYSVDAMWMIPHFEKMLYDNGALLATYSHTALATGEALFHRIAGETADWILRDMRSPEGAFHSSLDADSEHHEGKFYVWDREEIRVLLPPDEYTIIERRFGLDREPNFEGRWHLHAYVSLADVAQETGRDAAEVEQLVEQARARLLEARNARIWPARDEKVLTSWNAMTIRGLALAARVLERPDLEQAATAALDFIRRRLWCDGRLLATCKDDRAHLNAYLDDYVLLADAILELNQTRWRSDEIAWLRELLDATLAHFEDREAGGFYFTSDDHEELFHRPKSFPDDATPSGNGVAAFVLQRAGYLLGETRWLDAAERTLRAAWSGMTRYPQAHASLLMALDEHLNPPEIVVIRGEAGEAVRWQRELQRLYAPRRLVLAVPNDADAVPAAIADKATGSAPTAWICTGMTCSAPIDSLEALARYAVTQREARTAP